MKYKITTVLPVSRTLYLDRVLDSLVNQTHKPQNLIVIFDGKDNDYLDVRNKIVQLKFDNILCIKSNNGRVAFNIAERRIHIANIHNQAKELIGDADLVFSVEDDGILPLDALARLIKNVNEYDNVGMITGVELGRWGVPYVGAWNVDDIFNVSKTTSLENHAPSEMIQEIDACGLYCALIRADKYKEHTFFTNNGLGPDVNLGVFLRQQGFKNYINWAVPVTHLTTKGTHIIELPATGNSRVVELKLLSGRTWKY